MAKKRTNDIRPIFLLFVAACLVLGCVESPREDTNIEVPAGDPPFPPGQVYGIIDPNHYLDQRTINECLPIIDKLRNDGIAEISILIMPGVKNDPETYATHYGRYARLGQKEKDNGLVWLIRPDVRPEDNRITYSIGRGLPKFTANDALDIMIEVTGNHLNKGELDEAVILVVKRSDEELRRIYGG